MKGILDLIGRYQGIFAKLLGIIPQFTQGVLLLNFMADLQALIRSKENETLATLLDENPQLADTHTPEGLSLLMYAAYCRNQPAIEMLQKMKTSFSPFEAAAIGDGDTLFEQVEKSPEMLHAHAKDGFTLLGLSCFFGHTPIAEKLIQAGADVNQAANNAFKVAPIHSACATSNFPMVELLLRHGANVNAKQQAGVTPLHSAAHNGQTHLAKLLIRNGADVQAKTDEGKTPLDMAREMSFSETVALLENS